MKSLNELLGFAVLTGPLWLILILLAIAIWIAVKAAKRFVRRSAKFAVGLLVFSLIFFLPFGDEITGRIYLDYLCATKAGVSVYRTIELPAEYWDEQGRPKFYDEKTGNFNLKAYRIEYKSGVYSSFFHIENAGYKRVDGRFSQVLGEVTDFRYWGGWMRRNLSPHNTATRCSGGIERSNNLIKQMFKPKAS
jgi:hypothetical protein